MAEPPERLRQILEDAGVETVYEETYAIDTKNFDTIVSSMKNADPDLVVHGVLQQVPEVRADRRLAAGEPDPAQAERFYGNRIVAGLGSWLSRDAWNARSAPRDVEPGTQVVAGFDGSDVDDWTGFRCETRDGYQFTPLFADGSPMIWNPAEHGGQVRRDRAVVGRDGQDQRRLLDGEKGPRREAVLWNAAVALASASTLSTPGAPATSTRAAGPATAASTSAPPSVATRTATSDRRAASA